MGMYACAADRGADSGGARAGTTLLRKLKRQVNQHEKRLLQNFSPAERETFITLLQKVFPEHR